MDLRFSDKMNYLFTWLSAPASQMRASVSHELDADKRIDSVLSTLHKEREANVLPFKPRKR